MTPSDATRATLSWLATYGLHSTAFLGGVWLLCRVRAPRIQRNRERLWKLALIGGVLSATLQISLGARPLLGRIAWPAPEEAVAAALDAAPMERLLGTQQVARNPPEHAPRGFRPKAEFVAPSEGVLSLGPTRRAEERPPAKANESRSKEGLDLATETHRATRPALSRSPKQVPDKPSAASATETKRKEGPRGASGEASSALASTTGALERAKELLPEKWAGLVLLGWGAVGLLGLAGGLASWTCLRRHMLGRRVLSGGPLLESLEALRAQANVRRPVRLSVSARIASPFSTGWLRPEICVPEAVLTDLTSTQQEVLLAHELAHIVRRDPAWFGLGLLLERVFFFQPLNRIARRELSDLAEVACDDWAVRWTGARTALASCLTQVAGWMIGEPSRARAIPGLAGHSSRLGQRVERLLDDRNSPACEPPTPWWPPLAGGALALFVLAAPGVSAVDAVPLLPGEPSWDAPQPMDAAAPEPPSASQEPHRVEAGRSVDSLLAERAVLASEVALLEDELGALIEELEARDLRTPFASALTRIDERMHELRSQHARVNELLTHLSRRNTPSPAFPPEAATPASIVKPGDLR